MTLDGAEHERSHALITTTVTLVFLLVQGGLVNNIEQRVLEAQDYVEQAKESIPKCKKIKKTSRRVRYETYNN